MLNHTLFLMMSASPHPPAIVRLFAEIFAIYAIWLAPLTLIAGWLRGDDPLRRHMVESALSTGIGLLIAAGIAFVWPQPRPFMIGLGTQLLAHSPDASFPSNHLTCLWSAAFSLLLHRRTRPIGICLSLLGLPMAWARIYLGVHFPLDILGAAMVSAFSAWLMHIAGRRGVDFTLTALTRVYRPIFKPFIQRGWFF